MEEKVILNMLICERTSPYWEQCVNIMHIISFPTSIETSTGHQMGLGLQVLLDYDNINEANTFAKSLLDIFPTIPLILISEVNVKIKNIPIGMYQDDSLVNPGRTFDKLVKEHKTGLYIYTK